MATELDTYSIQGLTNAAYAPYGIYNPFRILIKNPDAGVFKLKYRVKVTLPDGEFYEIDQDPVGEYANLDPLQGARDLYFKGDMRFPADEPVTSSYNKVSIQAGQIYATAANLPATFQGYDSPVREVLLYNGYTGGFIPINYVPDNWYETKPIKISYTQKNLYYKGSQPFVFYAMSAIPTQTSSTNYNENLIGYRVRMYDYDNAIVSDVKTAFELTVGLGYRAFQAPIFSSDAIKYIEYNFIYGIGLLADGFETESLYLHRYECLNSREGMTVFWLNRYSVPEWLHFEKFEKSIVKTRGKKILKTGYDAAAIALSITKDKSSREYEMYGDSYSVRYKLYSGWLTQEQLDSLVDLYVSKEVRIHLDDFLDLGNGEGLAVNLISTNYLITDVKDGLQKIEIDLEEAKIQPIEL